jgi:hypothetical protein
MLQLFYFIKDIFLVNMVVNPHLQLKNFMIKIRSNMFFDYNISVTKKPNII